ncbi:MAG: hypothetical protein J6C24_00130, partial [Clostridia bacterium]|nr:hypothetical protein [Clostridia bacterium]
RKFRILGRSNVAARAGYVTLYPQDVGNVLKMCGVDYYAYQIIVEREGQDYFRFKIATAQAGNTEEFLEILYKERQIIKTALEDGTLKEPIVEWCNMEDLEFNSRTGKLKVIIDKRK